MANNTIGASVLPLPFGIPILDQLLGLDSFNAPQDLYNELLNKTSLAIVGEDGTGKSVFGLHIASAYQALTQSVCLPVNPNTDFLGATEPFPLVMYVSSDLPWAAASKTWRDFYLDFPHLKYVPGASGPDLVQRRRMSHRLARLMQKGEKGRTEKQIERLFVPLTRLAVNDVAEFLHGYLSSSLGGDRRPDVGFLDLAAQTAGDDWLFIARILSSVQRRASPLPNLLVLDSVAGFEALVGETNSFGETMSRRARLAQLFRAAGDNWSIVLISEEPDQQKHQQEEYITDTVIHLYRRFEQRAVRRSLEIEKSRAHSFSTGRHVFEIRDGHGSSTGSWENPDDREAAVREEVFEALQSVEGKDAPHRKKYSAYIEVFASLEHLGSEFARRQHFFTDRVAPGGDVESFGIKNLDQMLEASSRQGAVNQPQSGLRHGTVTSLVGDEGTRKVALAEQFLISGFSFLPRLLGFAYSQVKTFRSGKPASGSSFLKWIASEQSLTEAGEVLREHQLDAARCVQRLGDQERHYADVDRAVDFFAIQQPGLWRLRQLEQQQRQVLKARWDPGVYYEEGEADSGRDNESALVSAFTLLRTSSGLLVPAVLVCSHDTSAHDLAKMVYDRHEKDFKAALHDFCDDHNEFTGRFTDLVPNHVRRLIERFIVVRRFELEDASASKLWNIIETCATHALNLLGHSLGDIHSKTTPLPDAGRIRMVISDWRSIRDTYPSVKDDPLFLPTVNFRLRRLGITTLIVDSETGRPDDVVDDPLSRALRNTVSRHIYTWKVMFFGEQRIAVTVLPAGNPQTAGVIRELRFDPNADVTRTGKVIVDRHFELYAGLQEGRAETVPLKVLLYGETPAFVHYAQSENQVMNRLFQGPPPKPKLVVDTLGTSQYESLRDYCHLSINRRLPYTMVFVIDGFWGLGHNVALRDQNAYLFNDLPDRGMDDDDAFGLFKQTTGQLEALEAEKAEFALENKKLEERPKNRREYFRNRVHGRGYQCRLRTKFDDTTDRVPFTWDFGFMLCSKSAWLEAGDIELQWQQRPEASVSVRDVWYGLTHHVRTRSKDQKSCIKGIVGWREFMEATVKVSQHAALKGGGRIHPFDISVTSPESLSCLLLEIWMSETLKDCREIEAALAVVERRMPELAVAAKEWVATWLPKLDGLSSSEYRSQDSGLIGEITFQEMLRAKPPRTPHISDDPWQDPELRLCRIVAGHIRRPGLTLQLYKAWLLVVDVLPFDELFASPPGFALIQDREPSPDAISARHWYKTACAATSSGHGPHRVPVALPGTFTTRGDWYLGVAKGSRSDLLADQALDILCSRRANRTRLHLGLGLPTRDILEKHSSGRIRTALALDRNRVNYVFYNELLKLGGAFVTPENKCEDRRWLFRSGIRDYDRQTIAVRRWIQRLFWWTPRFKQSVVDADKWVSGFAAYDKLCNGDFEPVNTYPSFKEFRRGIKDFAQDLDNCTKPEQRRG